MNDGWDSMRGRMWVLAAALAVGLVGCGDGEDDYSSDDYDSDYTSEPGDSTADGGNPFDFGDDGSGGVSGGTPGGGGDAITQTGGGGSNPNAGGGGSNPFDDGGSGGGGFAGGGGNNPFDDGGSGGGGNSGGGGANPFDNNPDPPVVHNQPNRPTIFKQHEFPDPGMNNQVACRILAPEGWKVEGGMTRISPQYFNIAYLFDVKFSAPDGRQAHFMPSSSFGFNNQQPGKMFAPTADGNITMPLPESPGKWIMEMSRLQPDPTVSNLQLVSEEMIPDLTQKLRQQSAQMYQMIEQNRQQQAQMEQMGGAGYRFDMGFDTQATKIVLRYTKDGKDLEETILMTWGVFATAINGQMSGGSWYIGLMRSMRGPVGTDYLNDPQLVAIFKSARNDPRWDAEMLKHYQAMARIRNKGAQDRLRDSQAAHRKRMQTLNETTDIINNGWRERQAVRDAGQERYIDSVHEVTPYSTPDGGTVKLPSFYDTVYTDGNDRFILSNDAFYNPNSDLDLTGSWQEIQQRR